MSTADSLLFTRLRTRGGTRTVACKYTPTYSALAQLQFEHVVNLVMALSKLTAAVNYPVISGKPHQPVRFEFPKRDFGKQVVVKRSCQSAWFMKWTWLHYHEDDDNYVFCHTCVKAFKELKMPTRNAEDAFVIRGFHNWKLATASFRQHEASACHREAVERIFTLPATTTDVGEALSTAHAQENRQCLLKILSNLRFLARQSCEIRGDGNEGDSNFMQLLKLRCEDYPKFCEWISKWTNKYTSHEMQNDLLKVMALKVLRSIAACLRDSPFFTIMSDKTTDVSN